MVFAILVYFSVMPMMPIAEAGAGLFTSPIFVLLFFFTVFQRTYWLAGNSPLPLHRGCVADFKARAGWLFLVSHAAGAIRPASYAIGSIITIGILAMKVTGHLNVIFSSIGLWCFGRIIFAFFQCQTHYTHTPCFFYRLAISWHRFLAG